MRILLLGANGQVGWELQRSLAVLGELRACERSSADLEKPDELRSAIRAYEPDVIVNAAAYTAVDKAESEVEKAFRINSEAVALLAAEARRYNAWLLHYSTDYVFDGTKAGAYAESDEPNPLNVYGKSKLDGERAITQSGCKYLIFRTSWVYAARGNNFAKTMLRLAREREGFQVVSDQFGAPTSAELLADVSALALHRLENDAGLREKAVGTYHLAAGGETSWYDYARFVVQFAREEGLPLKAGLDDIQPIPSSEYPVPAGRPLNSRLDTVKVCQKFGVVLPHWKFHVARMLNETLPNNR